MSNPLLILLTPLVVAVAIPVALLLVAVVALTALSWSLAAAARSVALVPARRVVHA